MKKEDQNRYEEMQAKANFIEDAFLDTILETIGNNRPEEFAKLQTLVATYYQWRCAVCYGQQGSTK